MTEIVPRKWRLSHDCLLSDFSTWLGGLSCNWNVSWQRDLPLEALDLPDMARPRSRRIASSVEIEKECFLALAQWADDLRGARGDGDYQIAHHDMVVSIDGGWSRGSWAVLFRSPKLLQCSFLGIDAKLRRPVFVFCASSCLKAACCEIRQHLQEVFCRLRTIFIVWREKETRMSFWGVHAECIG